MLDIRPVASAIGSLLLLLSAAMCVPAVVDALAGSRDWLVFTAAAAATAFFGAALMLSSRSGTRTLSLRQAFVLTSASWVVIAAFAALPFAFSETSLNATDAFFEAMSGITTTGSTVMKGLDRASPGILIWRALLQWLGGIGIIVLAVTVLPNLKIGGMQMFKVEAESDTAERGAPRAARITAIIASVYVGLTLVLGLALYIAGMNRFDAVAHAMSTIATGGFSTYDRSIGHFDSARIDVIVTIGMILGGMPFLLFFRMAQGNVRQVVRDDQLRLYLGLLMTGTAGVAAYLLLAGAPFWDALRHGAFTVASIMTGTGFFTEDFSAWAGLPVAILFFLTFVGGCAGSTAAGIKVFRLQILIANAVVQSKRLLRPHAVLIPYYNRRAIPEEVADSVMGFLFVYALAFAVLAMMLGMLGLDFITAVSGAASAISNVGPGLGAAIGPAGTFSDLPDAAKWLLSGGMLLGRLELFTVLVLFVPGFWRR